VSATTTNDARGNAAANGAGERRIQVDNPATGQPIGDVVDLSPEEVRKLVDRARAAQPGWEAVGVRERARHMRNLRAWMVKNRRRLAQTMMEEAGKTYDDALFEAFAMAYIMGFWARHSGGYLRDERHWARSPALLGRRIISRYEPLGVVGVIAPWNYPLVLGLGDAIPALMAGNAVVLKPSSITPLSSVMMVEEGMKAVGWPQDVCLVATGSGGTGSAVVDTADMIMFTGSTATGQSIAERAGKRLIPISLELGGKDPMLVLRDADLDAAADQAVGLGMFNNGQTCMSVERIYVEEPAYDEFVDKVVDRVKNLRHGVPGGPASIDVAALTGPGQVDIVERHVKDAVAKGAKVLAGGNRGPGENYFQPTVLVDVDNSMDCMTEETFGPTLPIVKVADVEEGLALANDTEYGLNASVFTRDTRKGEAVARRLQSGGSCVNAVAMNYIEMRVPFGGWKLSGVGGRHGAGGIRKYCKQQAVLVTPAAIKWDLASFPRRKGTLALMDRAMALFFGRGG